MKIEVKPHNDYNAIYVDGELFDWEIEVESLLKARKVFGDNPLMKKAIIGNIQQHFLSSFEQFTGKKVDLKQLIEVIEKGEL